MAASLTQQQQALQHSLLNRLDLYLVYKSKQGITEVLQ